MAIVFQRAKTVICFIAELKKIFFGIFGVRAYSLIAALISFSYENFKRQKRFQKIASMANFPISHGKDDHICYRDS